jgi:PPOX class probable F420-dependent enzyme
MTITDDLRKQRTMLLTTFRQDDSPVSTPVNVVVADGRAYLRTWHTSGKARRMVRHPEVTIAPSTPRGTQTGRTVAGVARLLSGEEARAAARLIDRRYPIVQRLLVPVAHRLRRVRTVHYEVSFDEDEARS